MDQTIFPFQWNHWANDGPRTTNCSEGWHRKVNARTRPHPGFYPFVGLLKELQDEVEADVAALNDGQVVRPRNKKYVKLDEEIQELKNMYGQERGDQGRYLDAVARKLNSK